MSEADVSTADPHEVTTAIDSVRREDDFHVYRALSKSAVATFVMALLGLFLMIFSWSMLILPLAGIVFGLIALSNIRQYPNELTGRKLAQVGIAFCGLVFVGGLATAITIYATEVPEGYQRISFYDLNIKKNARAIPSELLALEGQRVFIKGYVHPGVSDSGEVKKFVLVEDMGTCCFGGQPEVADMVEVDITSDDAIKYNRRLRRLGGVFRIAPNPSKTVGGLTGGLFKLEADYVK